MAIEHPIRCWILVLYHGSEAIGFALCKVHNKSRICDAGLIFRYFSLIYDDYTKAFMNHRKDDSYRNFIPIQCKKKIHYIFYPISVFSRLNKIEQFLRNSDG